MKKLKKRYNYSKIIINISFRGVLLPSAIYQALLNLMLDFQKFWWTCRDLNPESQSPKLRALSNWATGPLYYYIGYFLKLKFL